MSIDWIDRNDEMPGEELLKKGSRILIFSPVYPEGNGMRYRVAESQFFKFMADATHWALLIGPED